MSDATIKTVSAIIETLENIDVFLKEIHFNDDFVLELKPIIEKIKNMEINKHYLSLRNKHQQVLLT